MARGRRSPSAGFASLLAHKLRETLLPALLENRFPDLPEDAADKSANPA